MRALVVALVTLSAAARAHADGLYFSEGLGTVVTHGELRGYAPWSELRGRVALGVRTGAFAFEGWFSQAQPWSAGILSDHADGKLQMTGFGVDVRFVQPLWRDHLETYLHAGPSKVFLTGGGLGGDKGRGLGGGVGLALKGKVRALGFLWTPLFFTHKGPKVSASIYVDEGIDVYRFHGPAGPASIEGRLSNVMLGFAVGSDF